MCLLRRLTAAVLGLQVQVQRRHSVRLLASDLRRCVLRWRTDTFFQRWRANGSDCNMQRRFIKIGTFYELYEDDAQIGVDVLNFKMTITGVGHCRQVGCPQSGIEDACQRLLAAGYKVGRIEQTETAAEAKARRGPKVRSLHVNQVSAYPGACHSGSTCCMCSLPMLLMRHLSQAKIARELVRVYSPATTTGATLKADAVHLMVSTATVALQESEHDRSTDLAWLSSIVLALCRS